MPVGQIVLVLAIVLVYFGIAHRVLDRMRLTDRQALLFLALMLAGSPLTLRLVRAPELTINVGGGILPLALSLYLIITADTGEEKLRAILAAAGTALFIGFLFRVLPSEPTEMAWLDPTYLFAIMAGLFAYLLGGSRRAAFVAGALGYILLDLSHYVTVLFWGLTRTRTAIGGAGVFDSTVIAAVLAVLVAEIVGESREFADLWPRGRNRT
ncbi:MAG: DUF1614 domain-containing protein [Symbiobacteriia bacterium]